MTRRLLPLLLLAAATVFASNLNAQSRAEMLRRYPWVDTTGESGVYPIGDAVDVYRAALDLLYKDGDEHPSVIVVHDTIEQGGEKPCPVNCAYVWHHKSKIDTTAILAFARQSPKRPRFKKFDYSVPIVLLSYNDMQILEHEGIAYLAAHNLSNDFNGRAAGTGFSLKFPGAWGLAQFGKVGFNTNHTEALVQVRHSCFESCGSDEALFLKRLNGRWTVIERIPTYAQVYMPPGQPYVQRSPSRGSLQYRGPAGSTPSESEIVGDGNRRTIVRSERVDAAAVYRAVLDSLYRFQGETPPVVVLTNVFRTPLDSVRRPQTQLDSGVLQKYAFLANVHATPERAFKYRLPVRIFLADSIPRLDSIGARIADPYLGNETVWLGLKKEVPGAWGMVGFSNVAFNLPHTQAMVYSDHQCGESCGHGDTWVLERKGESWHVVERIPGGKYPYWEPLLFPLRYVGLDAKPNAYHHRHVYARFVNAVTNQPLSSLALIAFHKGDRSDARVLTTDAGGRIDLGAVPFAGIIGMQAACPDQSLPDSLDALEFLFSPGADTVVSSRIDFRQCFKKSEPLGITGAKAYITPTEAQFTFPIAKAGPTPATAMSDTDSVTTQYAWHVDFYRGDAHDGEVVALWLGGSSKKPRSAGGPTAQQIASHLLQPMLICTSCHESLIFEDREVDHTKVFAFAEQGHVVFTVTGAKTVKRIFPTVPRAVTFKMATTEIVRGKRVTEVEGTQTVIVNCRPLAATGYERRMCNAPRKQEPATPTLDSATPRRVKVVALTYDGASLVRSLDVSVRSEDRKDPTVTRSTGQAGSFLMLQPARDSIAVDALCPGSIANERPVSGSLALYLAPGRDTTLQLLVDPRRCSQ